MKKIIYILLISTNSSNLHSRITHLPLQFIKLPLHDCGED